MPQGRRRHKKESGGFKVWQRISPPAVFDDDYFAKQEAWRVYRQTPCAYCGHRSETMDHVVPVASFGHNAVSNLVPACESCNKAKAARSLREFLTESPQRAVNFLEHARHVDEEAKAIARVIAPLATPRQRTEKAVAVEAPSPNTAADPKYRASLELLPSPRQFVPPTTCDKKVIAHGFRHHRERVPALPFNDADCVNGKHLWLSKGAVHDERTIVFKECRVCGERTEWKWEPREPEYRAKFYGRGVSEEDVQVFFIYKELGGPEPWSNSFESTLNAIGLLPGQAERLRNSDKEIRERGAISGQRFRSPCSPKLELALAGGYIAPSPTPLVQKDRVQILA